MTESVKIPLSQPIQAHGETLTELTFRPPTGRDLRAAGAAVLPDGTEDSMWDWRLLGACCSIPPSTIDDMAIRDVMALRRTLNSFLVESKQEPS